MRPLGRRQCRIADPYGCRRFLLADYLGRSCVGVRDITLSFQIRPLFFALCWESCMHWEYLERPLGGSGNCVMDNIAFMRAPWERYCCFKNAFCVKAG